MPTLPDTASFDAIRLESLVRDLTERVAVLERAFGTEPARPMAMSARPDASLLRARISGLAGRNKGDS